MNEDATQERLSSLDEWGDRKHIIPATVHGVWRRRRQKVHAVLLLIFLILPWTKINGLQTIWFDVPARRFTILGQVFLAHDAPLLFFIFAIVVLSLALMTALWGRVWCGWSCPQTVFIETIYRRIEGWIEGNYIQRRRMMNSPASFGKFLRRAIKWFAYFLVSSLIAHSFIAYFAGAEPLLHMVRGVPEGNWSYFLVVTFVTALLAFDFGWFREQFCIIMCPYGRFQSVLMDEGSLTVTYDQARGEPRRSALTGQKFGDCVSCNRCVQVCPTGIDIRNGAQMECIGCTACIDACDEIMKNLNKPSQLISYRRQSQQAARWTRPRVLVNLLLLALLSLGLGFNLTHREAFYTSILRAKDNPYQRLPSGEIVNHFKLHVQNQSLQTQSFSLSLSQDILNQGVRLTQTPGPNDIPSGQDLVFHFFTTSPAHLSKVAGVFEAILEVREKNTGALKKTALNILGPKAE